MIHATKDDLLAGTDPPVLAQGPVANDILLSALGGYGGKVISLGVCPRGRISCAGCAEGSLNALIALLRKKRPTENGRVQM